MIQFIEKPTNINAWKQRALRDGINWFGSTWNCPSEDAAYMTSQYTNAFTAKTKAVQVTHIMNRNGQNFPVK